MIYAIVTIIVVAFADFLVAGMAQTHDLRSITVDYIRLEALSIPLTVIYDLCIIVLITLNLRSLLYSLLIARTLATVLFDTMLVGQFSFSLDLGVVGVAYTNIAVNFIMLAPCLLLFRRLKLWRANDIGDAAEWKRNWRNIALRSGLESATRNLAFSLMILRLVNEVQEAGPFWVTNTFIWVWLLLPVLSLGTLIKQDVGVSEGALGARFSGYIILTTLIALIWLATIPLWNGFVGGAMGVEQPAAIVNLALLMLGFYIVFAYNNVLDSYFYGLGRTDLMLYQSLFVSIVYYGGAFLLYLTGHFVPTLQGIAVLFGGGILVDSLVTLWLFVRSGYPIRGDMVRDGSAPTQTANIPQ